ncbi:DUF3592 domain-containing protein [Frankia nepalensis]|uniref:DUF3592 domain-containing protein n=2 Tax=Frankia nepalensis TaxID=1836974 RepID=A0A937UPZ0_9ACTN|nr:DUF3592 domain-containing protein [Frankia nepalensis]MBL7496981.1 hypothetical protein [Frankia nepalensis]MBL7511318.1 hypothetical protein [Frankia nepalensis]MBL7626086.1 hypothetical protein [Frankia nepalensis]
MPVSWAKNANRTAVVAGCVVLWLALVTVLLAFGAGGAMEIAKIHGLRQDGVVTTGVVESSRHSRQNSTATVRYHVAGVEYTESVVGSHSVGRTVAMVYDPDRPSVATSRDELGGKNLALHYLTAVVMSGLGLAALLLGLVWLVPAGSRGDRRARRMRQLAKRRQRLMRRSTRPGSAN